MLYGGGTGTFSTSLIGFKQLITFLCADQTLTVFRRPYAVTAISVSCLFRHLNIFPLP